MSSNINELVLSGYEKLNDNGFASPVFTKAKKGNLRYRALSILDTDYQYRIKRFEEINTGSNYFDLSEDLKTMRRVSSIWTDVFIWDGEIYIGSRREIAQSLEHKWEEIKRAYPLTMIDLIEDLNMRSQYGLVENALQYLSKKHGEIKALDWMSGIYIKNELIKSYRVTLLNLNATKRELDAVGRIEVDRDGANLLVCLPKILSKYQINPVRLPRVSYAIGSLESSILGLSLRTAPPINSAPLMNADSLNETYDPIEKSKNLSILVIGIGGAGGNAVNNMITSGLEGVEFLIVNTDANALELSPVSNKIQIGAEITRGLGSGMRTDIGEAAAKENLEEILSYIDNADMVFLIAGMGGGTGTGATSVIGQAALERGILTIGCITEPFDFEGERRRKIADEGIERIFTSVDTLIRIPNQNLFRVATEKATMADAFAMADQVLCSTVQMMTDLMVVPGLINIDFKDVRSLIESMGNAVIGLGHSDGRNRAVEAAKKALVNPLMDDYPISSAKGVLINITGGRDLTLFEVDAAATYVRSSLDQDANIIIGSALDKSIGDEVRVSVLATGVHSDSKIEQVKGGGYATILTIKDGMCKWPIGDPSTSDFRFCGRTTEKDEPYCVSHSRVADKPSRRLGGGIRKTHKTSIMKRGKLN
jgi:cell division protein FtsZ